MRGGNLAEPSCRVPEEEEAHDLEHALPAPGVDVANVAELLDGCRLDARLLRYLAQRRRLGLLAGADQPLREGPDVRLLAGGPDRGQHPAAAQPPHDDPSGRELTTHRHFVTD